MYLYKVPSLETEIVLNPLKLLGTGSNFVPLAESCTLKVAIPVATGSGLTSGFLISGFLTSVGFTGVLDFAVSIFTTSILSAGLIASSSGLFPKYSFL